MIADGTIREACEKGFWHPDVPFNPAAWTVDELMYDESEGFVRYARLGRLLSEKTEAGGKVGVKESDEYPEDHYEDVPELQSIYSPAANKVCTICSHPGGVGDGCATAASTVTVLKRTFRKSWRSLTGEVWRRRAVRYSDHITISILFLTICSTLMPFTGRRISGGDSLNWRDTSLLIMRNSRRR